MKKCTKCNWQNKDNAVECVNCGFNIASIHATEKTEKEKLEERLSSINAYTTPFIADVKEHIGVVSYEVIFGSNIFKDIFANITDITGGRSSTYETVFKDAKNECINKVKEQCLNQGGNCIIDLKIEFLTVGESRMLMCYVSGTAVIVNKE